MASRVRGPRNQSTNTERQINSPDETDATCPLAGEGSRESYGWTRRRPHAGNGLQQRQTNSGCTGASLSHCCSRSSAASSWLVFVGVAIVFSSLSFVFCEGACPDKAGDTQAVSDCERIPGRRERDVQNLPGQADAIGFQRGSAPLKGAGRRGQRRLG
jgi:hypothetical protein